MRILAPCVICFKAGQAARKEGQKVPIVLYRGRITDDGIVSVECSEGHKSFVIYEAKKHDLLFESACNALLDGYEREAVSGFAAALERCYEFFIRVVCRTRQIDRDVFASTWKSMSSQSERQLGGFVLLYALETQQAYPLYQKGTEFRNRVIHRGYIPTRKEVLDYGDGVFSCCLEIMSILRNKHAVALEEDAREELQKRWDGAPKDAPVIAMAVTPVHVDRSTNRAIEIETFDDLLHAMVHRRESMN